jgi:hypothetical protein
MVITPSETMSHEWAGHEKSQDSTGRLSHDAATQLLSPAAANTSTSFAIVPFEPLLSSIQMHRTAATIRKMRRQTQKHP